MQAGIWLHSVPVKKGRGGTSTCGIHKSMIYDFLHLHITSEFAWVNQVQNEESVLITVVAM